MAAVLLPSSMKTVLLLGIIGLCLYLGITQTAQMKKEAEAKAAAEAAEKAGPPAVPAPAPANSAAASTLARTSPLATPAANALNPSRATPADAAGATPAPKPGDWMWQKATPGPKENRRGR